MFKTNPESLEFLSFALEAEDISRLRKLLDLTKRSGISTLPPNDFQRAYQGLESIERLKLEGKVYAFSVEDTYAAKQLGDSGWGVELYLRQGNKLGEFAINSDRDWVLKVNQVVPKLKERKISTIYTGPIIDRFLDLPEKRDPEDPMYTKKLDDFSIGLFESEGIKVVSLDTLV